MEKTNKSKSYMKFVSTLTLVFILTTLFACDSEIEKGVMKSDLSKDIEMVTDYGTVIMRLSDETPKHRNNFIRLVNENFFDSISFHRVIKKFLIQTGDYATKPSSLKNDSIDLPRNIDAEFRPNLFHKRGALNAARMGDDVNPSRSSDGSQFTIIQGKIQNDSTLNHMLSRVNFWRAKNNVINRPEYKNDFKKYKSLSTKIEDIEASKIVLHKEDEDLIRADFTEISNKIKTYNIDSLANIELNNMEKYNYPETHRKVYKSIGGSPHLDQNYTVFGEVIKGMKVVDSIADVATDKTDKPIKNVYILKTKMIERRNYSENID